MKSSAYFLMLTSFFLFNCSNPKTEEEDVVIAPPIEEPIPTVESNPVEGGKKIAMQTGGVLMANLTKAIAADGTENALTFCSTQAIPLTDSMSVALNSTIKRVSDKNSNPNNKANEEELAYITSVKETLSKGEQPTPKLTVVDGKNVAYYPIMTNQLCMQCHGKPNSEVLPNTLAKIKSLYPNDMAIGYAINELRGIWVVDFEAN
ncbi:Tll0287-like domain-containing protein [Crocinitomix catalasitica]|uniref:Tll0287-like domain-containing protein n=1 Tax=Crocinitomix catalasitica TaxID=184607 RepID=UPI00146F9BCB|nr:DUF3365 domain-containing protein [Crocinitomix catalasitica]